MKRRGPGQVEWQRARRAWELLVGGLSGRKPRAEGGGQRFGAAAVVAICGHSADPDWTTSRELPGEVEVCIKMSRGTPMLRDKMRRTPNDGHGASLDWPALRHGMTSGKSAKWR